MEPVDRIAPQDWMVDPPTVRVLAALAAEGAIVRFVGGCVRDALLGRRISDIDIATPDPPEIVVKLLAAASIKAVPTGIAHGTITAVVSPRHFEVTSLRRDVETFGRHARVAFTDDWAVDAARRDFTMNALFLDGTGQVFDPVEGLPDLRAGRVRFVGEASARIAEDVLRLLRFYRFHAHYGRGAADGAARAACRAARQLVPNLSGERVSAELLKLLAAPDPLPVLALMAEDGVLAAVLPEAAGLARLARLVTVHPEADRALRLAALLPSDAAVADALSRRLRFANALRDRLVAAAALGSVDLSDDEKGQRRALRRLGLGTYADLVRLRAAESGDNGRSRILLARAPEIVPPAFPLRGRDVRSLGIPAGPAIGALLGAVETWWEEGDYRAGRKACLARLGALAATPDAQSATEK